MDIEMLVALIQRPRAMILVATCLIDRHLIGTLLYFIDIDLSIGIGQQLIDTTMVAYKFHRCLGDRTFGSSYAK